MYWKRHTAGVQRSKRAEGIDWKRHTAGVQEAVGHNAETEQRERTGRDIQQVYMRQKGTMLKQSRGNGLDSSYSKYGPMADPF